MSRKSTNLLPQVSFGILLALSLKPRHGYELMQQIEHDSLGKIKLGPGALYGAIKQLNENGLIEEMPYAGDSRRRYWRITRKGYNYLSAEVEYFENSIRLAQNRKLFNFYKDRPCNPGLTL